MAGLVLAVHVFNFPLLDQNQDARHKACAGAGRRPDPNSGHDSVKGGLRAAQTR